MLKAYWLRILLFAICGAVIAGIITMLVPKKYEALVELTIDQKPISTSIPMNSAESAVADLIDFSRPRSLSTTIQQLVAFGIVTAACERVAATTNETSQIGSGGDLDPLVVRDSISVGAESTSDIVSLRVRSSRPDIARALAAALPDAYSKSNTDTAQAFAQQAIFILNNQLNPIKAQLAKVDSEVERLRMEARTPDVATQMQSDITTLNKLREQLNLTKVEIDAAINRRNALEQEYSRLQAESKLASSVTENPAYQNYKRDLVAAKVRLAALRERYTEERDEVKAAKQEVRDLYDVLKETPKTISSSTTGPDETTRTVRQNLIEARTAVGILEARKVKLEQEVAAGEANLLRMPAIMTKLLTAQREQEALQRLILTFTDRLVTLQAAGVGRVSPIRITTPAVVIPDPVSPKPLINVLFGIAAGIIVGVLSMLATEARRQPVRSLAQLNALALRPVYRMVPELRQPYRGLAKAPAEAYDSLLANYVRSQKRPYRVAIVGITKDSGASTAAINLAIAGARHGARVLLVQCDPRGGVSRLTGKAAPNPGEFQDVSNLIKATSAETVLTVSGDRNPELTAEIQANEADLTIIDLEPTTRSAEYAFVAPHVDEIVLLVRAGRAKSVEFLQAQQSLRESGCPTVTVCFTRASDLSVVTEAVDDGTNRATPTVAGPTLPEA